MGARIVVVLWCLLAGVPGARAADVTLTNADVVEMVKAGLGEAVVVGKIKTAPRVNFDTSTGGLVKLKKAGVKDQVVNAMMERQAVKAPMVASAPAGAGGAAPAAVSQSIHLKDGGKLVELLPIVPNQATSMKKAWIPYYYGPLDNWMYLRGPKAAIRVKSSKPVFLSGRNPSEFRLVRLDYHSGKDIRYAVFKRDFTKNDVQVSYKEDGAGGYEVVPASDLAPGEYAFMGGPVGTVGFWSLWLAGRAGATGFVPQFYDFGIEAGDSAQKPEAGT
ncbi:MAG: hypothetical protein HY039_00980 [Nitrospirae bacterium]|nr:hypothetical protein [Nitrospirota bacterium]